MHDEFPVNLGYLSALLNIYGCLHEFPMQVDHASAGVQYDKEFIVCSLDLLSGLTEGLGSGIESLVFPFLLIFS